MVVLVPHHRGPISLIIFSLLAASVAASKEKDASTQDAVLSPGENTNALTFTALTKPLPLFPGEVTNTWHHIDIPPGPIAISGFAADIVEKDPVTGNLVAVPIGDAYLHHHVVYSSHEHYKNQKHWWSPMKPAAANRGVGFGAGTESRGTWQSFPYPYRFTTVEGEGKNQDFLLLLLHIIFNIWGLEG
jgi:hypothetical protein